MFSILYNCMKGRPGQVGVAFFSQVTRTEQEKITSSCTNGGLDWILGKCCQALERAAQESIELPYPEVFKRCVDVAFEDTV